MLQSLKNYYHLLRAIAAVQWYGKPANKLHVIGVTGTDGKTTTASIIYHILKESGHKAALISTVSAVIGDKEYDTGFHVSTPDSSRLQAYISKAVKENTAYLVLEVTSHALDQHRAYGIPFKIGVLTNISREHLDYHKTMERYMLAKAKLLKASEIAVLNKDDSSFSFMINQLHGKKIVTYGLTKEADINPLNHTFTSNLQGDFNTYNILAALSVSDLLGIDQAKARKAVETFKLPNGRYDVVYNKEFKIIIDFAHTPNALMSILKTVVKDKKGELIHVFGSAGERDKGKRPLMGEASQRYADRIILTSEDPRNESPESIAKDIMKGMKDTKKVDIIADRQTAITQAIKNAQKNDIVLITGKGHETSMNLGQGEVAWSDHQAVTKALEK